MKQQTLRLSDELHARLKAMADADRRSMHAEILWLIEEAIAERDQQERTNEDR
jgi:predicted transcriptional regulator